MRSFGLCSIVLIYAAGSIAAQQQQPTFDVQFAGGNDTFRIGERISLKLTFSSPNDTDYIVAPASGSRGGEFGGLESVSAIPETGWADPLALYLKQERPITGHGWQWPPLLQAKPVTVSVDLNQWIRFDRPGDYIITVQSRRVAKSSHTPPPLSLSKSLQVHIIPATQDWQNEKLAEILEHLDKDTSSWRDLRYLGTPGAINVMTSRLTGNSNLGEECELGIAGLPDSLRATAIASMEKRMKEPSFPVSPRFFSTMELLHVRTGSNKDGLRIQEQSYDPVLWSAIFSLVETEEPSARAQTLQTLLYRGGYSLSTPDRKTKMQVLLRKYFLDLDPFSQAFDLRSYWDYLRSPDFVPTLREVAKRPVTALGDVGSNSSGELKSLALMRWYELDPEGAHREILRQIGSSPPTIGGKALAFLPDEQLPQFEPTWAEAFLNSTMQGEEMLFGSLLVRFGTGAASKQVIAKLDQKPRNYACEGHVLALAYLIRFHSEEALPRLRNEIATDEGKCGENLFRWIPDYATGPALNDVAVENLGKDMRLSQAAVQYLAAYGRQQDKGPMLQLFDEWSRRELNESAPDWKGTAELREFVHSDLGLRIGEALIANQGWLADSDLIAHVVSECEGEQPCRQIGILADSAKPPYKVRISSFLPTTFSPASVAQYNPRSFDLFDEKLTQFPSGSRFALQLFSPLNSDGKQIEEKVRSILAKHGFALEESAPFGARDESFAVGGPIPHPEALSGTWEAPDGNGGAIGIHLTIRTTTTGDVANSPLAQQNWRALSLAVFHRSGPQLQVGEANYFTSDTGSGAVKLERGRLTLHSPGFDLDLVHRIDDTWSGRVHRKELDASLTLARPGPGKGLNPPGFVGTWRSENEPGRTACMHVLESGSGEFTGWVDYLGASINLGSPSKPSYVSEYGELAQVNATRGGGVTVKLHAHSAGCCSYSFAASPIEDGTRMNAVWLISQSGTHGQFTWNKVQGGSCAAAIH